VAAPRLDRVDRALLATLAALALFTGCGGSQMVGNSSTSESRPVATQSKTFKYAGKPQHFVVPSAVTEVRVEAVGGSGARGFSIIGGSGGGRESDDSGDAG
jgi:hypothetical protein